MEDNVCRTLAILARGLPDVMFVKFPFIPPDHIMLDGARLSKMMVAVLVTLAQDQTIISMDQMLKFLLEVKGKTEDYPELCESVNLVV